ncbi:MAG: homoserine dehydrogenase [Candidatus Latescibacterota bacterium]|nr:homoserine dehydrogenase [Candidatus Latescibacterota bacterium]
MSEAIGIGMIGLGTVGGGVAQLLLDAPSAMRRREGVRFQIQRVAVRDPKKSRAVSLADGVVGTDPGTVLSDPSVQVVVELTGAPSAVDWISDALKAGKDVVTANKAVIAEHGDELFALALERGVDLMFEASVAGGIPIIRSLRNGLVANRVESLSGILNGTTNYIMTRMTRGEGDYATILADAQEKGFAESDPTMDVSGQDAAQKLVILSRIAFHTTGTAADVFCEGIESIETVDIEFARELGYTIKLLAIAKHNYGDKVEARVHPVMVPNESLLANIHDEYNAIEVVGSAVDTQVFYGKGAGRMPTASAVVSDLVELAQRKRSGATTAIGDMILGDEAASYADVSDSEIRYYLRMRVKDQPGVLEAIARILAHGEISIASVLQKERDLQGGAVPLVIVTHEARESAMQEAISAIDGLDIVEVGVRFIRMEEL